MKTLNQPQFFNRELSWLEFNQRVLDQAVDSDTPLLERLKFFCIASSNLDEFFEVRVAGIKQQVESEVMETSIDGLSPAETFRAITERVRRMVEFQNRCWREDLRPALAKAGINFLNYSQVAKSDRAFLERYYTSQVRPVLTPLAIDPAHPFPQLLNKSLNIMVELSIEKEGHRLKHLAVVQVPRVLPRLVRLPGEESARNYILLGELIGSYLADLFPGTEILGFWTFRVTRNSELYIDEEEVGNLLKAVENELHNRRKGDAVRLELEKNCPLQIRKALLATLQLTEDDLYILDGPLNPTRLMAVYDGEHSPELRDPSFIPAIPSELRPEADIFASIQERDLLLHHPYESFAPVVEFLERAAEDPKVLAIKQTLYRTGGDPRIIGALMNAVKNGKQVTVVVELRARFDEANNILWANKLEEAGVHVVYGIVGYKIHAKMCMVVRKEGQRIRRYINLGTGNYNPNTAKVYTDLSFFTCKSDIAEEVTTLFNLLTGICQFQPTRKLVVAPFELHRKMLRLIDRERQNALRGLPARIVAKMNSLVDPEIIQALYHASAAGVKIELIVRGICCLIPGSKGLSENISVRSIVDRFLEHSRLFYFQNGGNEEVYVSSADWMPRNFFRRIEIAFPIEEKQLRDRIIHEVLGLLLADNVKAYVLKPTGAYERSKPPSPAAASRSQVKFIGIATGEKPRLPKRRGRQKAEFPALALRSKPDTAPTRN